MRDKKPIDRQAEKEDWRAILRQSRDELTLAKIRHDSVLLGAFYAGELGVRELAEELDTSPATAAGGSASPGASTSYGTTRAR